MLGVGVVLVVGKGLEDLFMANRQFDFSFNDASSGEIQTNDISRIRAGLTKKIRDAEVLLVLIGKEANKHHRDWMQIGYRNWINFEVAQARAAGKRLVAVKIDKNHESPEQIDGAALLGQCPSATRRSRRRFGLYRSAVSVSDNDRLEVLAEHYRETVSLQRGYIGRRDRAFRYALNRRDRACVSGLRHACE